MPAGVSEFMDERKAQEEKHLKVLHEALPDIPRQDLLLVAQDVVGREALEIFAARL
jgi:hypothetical protein